MKELWDAKGYGELGFSNQNLRDQAARLEKSVGVNSQNTSMDERAELNCEFFAARSNMSSDCQPVIDPSNSISQAINLSETEEEYKSSRYGNSQVLSSNICIRSAQIVKSQEESSRRGGKELTRL